MPVYPNWRLRAVVVQADRAALFVLRELYDFKPHNPAHSAEAVTELANALDLARLAEARATHALAAARDAAQAAEWALHDAMLGVKAEATAQYGANSDQIQALGLKKKSDRRRPSRRTRPSAEAN